MTEEDHMRTVITSCSGADCIAITDIGGDWYRIFSTVVPTRCAAVTGAELRAFLRQVKAGQFDTIARLEPDTIAYELMTENAELRGRLEEFERLGRGAA